MHALRKLQQQFLGRLLHDADLDILERIESTPQRSAKQRMQLYANAYRLRLKEALSTDYERLHSYLGDELFETLMNEYIDRYPSRQTSLRYFGQHMVALVQSLEPFCNLLEVAELTQIEQAFAHSFDAADCQSVSLQQLAQLQPEAWASLTLRFHDAVQLLPQQYNSFQIWQALSNGHTPPQKMVDETTWLIWRQERVSRYRALEKAELTALTTAQSVGSFADLCVALMDHYSDQETPLRAAGYLQQWINDQMVCELKAH